MSASVGEACLEPPRLGKVNCPPRPLEARGRLLPTICVQQAAAPGMGATRMPRGGGLRSRYSSALFFLFFLF